MQSYPLLEYSCLFFIDITCRKKLNKIDHTIVVGNWSLVYFADLIEIGKKVRVIE